MHVLYTVYMYVYIYGNYCSSLKQLFRPIWASSAQRSKNYSVRQGIITYSVIEKCSNETKGPLIAGS